MEGAWLILAFQIRSTCYDIDVYRFVYPFSFRESKDAITMQSLCTFQTPGEKIIHFY